MKGFTDTTNDIHQFATIIEFPRNRYKSVKAIAKYLIEKIPILDKYISIVKQSKEIAPICYISKPKVEVGETYTLERHDNASMDRVQKDKKKNEEKLDKDLTPIVTNTNNSDSSKKYQDTNMFVDNDSLQRISSIEELSDDTSLIELHISCLLYTSPSPRD